MYFGSIELQHLALDSIFVVKMRPVRILGMIAYTSSSDEEVPMLCKVDETTYKVKDGYKIELRTLDPVVFEHKTRQKHVRVAQYGCETFYTSDLAALIRSGQVKRVTVVKSLQEKLNSEQLAQLVRVM